MLVIFSRLAIPARDREWIERIRQRHDPQHRFIDAHFTFVFPFSGVEAGDALAHARDVAAPSAPISFRLSTAAAVRDPLGPRSHVFLRPSVGAEEMIALHAHLYSGPLAAHRHPTITFAPHVTVGAFEAHPDATRAAASLGAFDIAGTLESLHLAAFDGHTVVDLHELRFGG